MKHNYRIVVGVDGSAGGERALRWAVHEASHRGATAHEVGNGGATAHEVAHGGATVHAVTAFTFDGIDGSHLANRERQQELAEQMLGAQVVTALADDPRVAVTTRVVYGSAIEVLLDSARGADLLVLGSHGHGRLHHAVLGSVAEACVRGGVCPVVIVPVPAADRQPASAGAPTAIL